MKKILASFIVVGLIYVAFLHYQIVEAKDNDVPVQADYMIVLGARVKGSVPSLALKARIDKAAEYLEDNQSTIVIASGGKGPGENISEAESIKRELVDRGIQESRILLENRSTNTYENVQFSRKILPENMKTGLIVTNDFHIYRAVEIAKDEELQIAGLPAETPIQAVAKSYLREYMAITKYYLQKYLF